MQITINTEAPLSDVDLRVLAALTGEGAPAPAPAAAEAEKAEEKPKAKAKAAAKPKPAPEPEPEDDDDDDDDVVGGDGPTLDDAIARATGLVQKGKSTEVKAALKAVGAKKVSELDSDQVAEFMAALDA